MNGDRAGIVKHILDYSDLKYDDLDDIRKRLNISFMRFAYEIDIREWSVIRLGMIAKAKARSGDEIRPCSGYSTFADCFVYDDLREKILLYYNDKKDNTLIIEHSLKGGKK